MRHASCALPAPCLRDIFSTPPADTERCTSRKFRLLENPAATTELCRHIAERFRAAAVEIVAGPTTGGTILAFETARQLRAKAFSAERNPQGERADLRARFHLRTRGADAGGR